MSIENAERISYEEYYEITNILNDERLSRKGVMNFKNLKEVNFYGTCSNLIYSFFPAIGLTYLMQGKAKRSHSGYRYQWPLFFVAYPMTLLFTYTVPLPRRLYTEIFTDPDLDGTYVRSRLKHATPGLWRRISRQLFEKGYNFPEMNEVTNGRTLPMDFVFKIK